MTGPVITPTTLYRSRTEIQTRRDCEMLAFLAYHYNGHGVARKAQSLPLVTGTAVHAILAAGMRAAQQGADPIPAAMQEHVVQADLLRSQAIFGLEPEVHAHLVEEQIALMEGLTRGWFKHRWPILALEFDIVSVEHEWRHKFTDSFGLKLRFDTILRRKSDGMLHILDWKTARVVGPAWESNFRHALQSVLYVEALERAMGEFCAGIIYDGLVKGVRKVAWKQGKFAGLKVQQSPLVYGYVNRTGDITAYRTDYTQARGWERIAVWQEMPMERWLSEVLDSSVYAGLFPTIGPIRPTEEERQVVVAQAARREAEFQRHVELIRVLGGDEVEAANKVLERNGANCLRYGTDNECEMYAICHYGVDPFDPEVFEIRTDHHAMEEEFD